jgi:uncharacterized protein involved in response to NO
MEHAILVWLGDSWLAHLMVNVPWLHSACESVHFIGLSLMIGVLLIVDLRALGVFPQVDFKTVHRLIPFAILGFSLNLVSGVAFVCNDPTWWYNPMFKIKMLAILIAGANALEFTFVEEPKVRLAANGVEIFPNSIKISAALSLFSWFIVIVAGRMLPIFASSQVNL